MIYVLDLDGTLIDSSERHSRLMRQILSEAQPEIIKDTRFDPVEFMEYKADGNSGLKYLTDQLGLPEDAAGRIMSGWQRRIEDEYWLKLDVLYPDALEFLNCLKQRHRKIYYLTARQNKEGLLRELERLGIAGYADEIIVVLPAGAGEEKKAAVERLLRKAGETEGPVCIVGDTENEYTLAKELSLPCYLLNRGFRSERYWSNRGVKSIASLYGIESENAECESTQGDGKK